MSTRGYDKGHEPGLRRPEGASEQPGGADWEDITVFGGKVLGEESDMSRTTRLVKTKLGMGRRNAEGRLWVSC